MTQRLIFKWAMALLPLLLSISAQAEVPMTIEKVTDNVYALVGELTAPTPENHANNSTHGVIVTNEGVILVDPGGSFKGAEQIAKLIKTITPQPIKYVINTGGQDHRWLGNSYFKEHGATIISSKAAYDDQKKRTNWHLNRVFSSLGKEGFEGTTPIYPDVAFDTKKSLDFGGIHLELYHKGAAHTVGDIFVWMPGTKIMFAGDIIFADRLLGIGPARDSQSWMKVFKEMVQFEPVKIVPGHGHVCDVKKATQDTYDYLSFLRKEVTEILDKGGDMQDAIKIDQTRFSYLENYDIFATKVAQSLFEQMEFE